MWLYEYLWALIRRFDPPGDHGDWVHDCWVAVTEAESQFDPSKSSRRTWVYMKARNTMIDTMRRNKRYSQILERVARDAARDVERWDRWASALRAVEPDSISATASIGVEAVDGSGVVTIEGVN